MHNNTALITGATTGIGYELTKLFANDGFNLVLVARNEERLSAIKSDLSEKYGISIKTIAKDLSLPESSQAIYDELEKESIMIDILVNNAGFGLHGFFCETDIEMELKMIRLNIIALTHLTKLMLKDMISSDGGKILNVASTAGFIPGPLMAVYYATKAYVLSFSDALSNELSGTGITVTVLCPGPTKTEFANVANTNNTTLFNTAFMKVMSAEKVARIGYRALMKGESTVIAGFMNKLIIQSAVRTSPRKIVAKITRWLNGKK